MASMTLHVPAELVETIHDELLLYQEVQFDATCAGQRPSENGANPRSAAARLRATDAILTAVSWDARRQDQPVDLTGEQEVLAEVVHGAMLGAVDRLGRGCHRTAARTADIGRISELLEHLSALVTLNLSVRPAR